MSSHENLYWDVRTDKKLIGTAGGQRHLVIEVKAPEGENLTSERPPLNLGLVIDASGSMQGPPLAAAREAARGVLSRLGPNDRLSLVSFADDVIIHVDAMLVDEVGRRQASQAIDGLGPRGCTDLAAGWLAGSRCVAAAMDRAGTAGESSLPTQNRVILLSDGHANRGIVDPQELGHHAAQLRRRGLYSSTIGIGDGYSPVQLDAIAEHGGGRAHDAPGEADIVAVVLGELGEILQMAAEDLTVTLRPTSNFGLEVFGRYPVSKVGGETRVSLGSLVCGQSRQLVLQVTLPAGRLGDRHGVEIVPDWRDCETGARLTGATLATSLLVVSDAEAEAEVVDPDLAREVARMWQSHLHLNSTLLNSEGRYDEAREFIGVNMQPMAMFCQSFKGGSAVVDELALHEERVGVVMEAAETLAEVSLSRMTLKGEQDFRVNKRK